MKIKTSVSLSSQVLDQVSIHASDGERSEFIEKALWNYLESINKMERNMSDLKKINASAEYFNKEALDTLEYQVLP